MVKRKIADLRRTDRNKTPLCVRFRPEDLDTIRLAASRRREAATVLIREWVMMRVVAIERGLKVSKIDFAAPGDGVGDPISVRFRQTDYDRLLAQAVVEGCGPSQWVRAVAIDSAQRARPVAVGA